MNAQRLAFLESVEDDLVTSHSNHPMESGGDTQKWIIRRSKGAVRAIGSVASALAITTGFFIALSSNAANASTGANKSGPIQVQSCSVADPIPQTQSKWCNFANYVFAYQYNYSPNGGLVRCYVFDLTIYNAPCGGTVRVGRQEACA